MESDLDKQVLLAARRKPLASLDALEEKALAALTARIWQTCCWSDEPGPWTIGDYRFAIVEFEPAPNVVLYAQFWSEPHEPVLMEVSSGNWNPGAVRYVWRRQRKMLEERGFKVGGAARNFQKDVLVTSPEEAEAVAKETLAIFFDVFSYRGRQPLTTKLHAGSRAELAPVHTSLTPEDFLKMAQQSGFQASLVVSDSEEPVVVFARGAFHSAAIFGESVAGSNLFASALLRAPIRGESALPLPGLLDDEAPTVAARFGVDAEGRAMAETVLNFDGGVTTEWVTSRLERWRGAVRRYQRVLKGARKRTPMRSDPIRGRAVVH